MLLRYYHHQEITLGDKIGLLFCKLLFTKGLGVYLNKTLEPLWTEQHFEEKVSNKNPRLKY